METLELINLFYLEPNLLSSIEILFSNNKQEKVFIVDSFMREKRNEFKVMLLAE